MTIFIIQFHFTVASVGKTKFRLSLHDFLHSALDRAERKAHIASGSGRMSCHTFDNRQRRMALITLIRQHNVNEFGADYALVF